MDKQRDASQVTGLCERIKKNFPGKKIYSHSFDKGFWSKDNHATIQDAAIEEVILPKKGITIRKIKQGSVAQPLKNFVMLTVQ